MPRDNGAGHIACADKPYFHGYPRSPRAITRSLAPGGTASVSRRFSAGFDLFIRLYQNYCTRHSRLLSTEDFGISCFEKFPKRKCRRTRPAMAGLSTGPVPRQRSGTASAEGRKCPSPPRVPTDASRIAFIDPKCLSSALARASPMPSISVSTVPIPFFCRLCR